jgi:serine/threonine protein phosphatase PrpC
MSMSSASSATLTSYEFFVDISLMQGAMDFIFPEGAQWIGQALRNQDQGSSIVETKEVVSGVSEYGGSSYERINIFRYTNTEQGLHLRLSARQVLALGTTLLEKINPRLRLTILANNLSTNNNTQHSDRKDKAEVKTSAEEIDAALILLPRQNAQEMMKVGEMKIVRNLQNLVIGFIVHLNQKTLVIDEPDSESVGLLKLKGTTKDVFYLPCVGHDKFYGTIYGYYAASCSEKGARYYRTEDRMLISDLCADGAVHQFLESKSTATCYPSSYFSGCTAKQMELTWQKTFVQMQQQIKVNRKDEESGGTCCMAAVKYHDEKNKPKLSVAWVGDSLVLKVNAVIGADSKCTVRVNYPAGYTAHNPNNELKRVGEDNIRHGRLMGGLAVSRSFGDDEYEKFNLSHEPSCLNIDFNTEEKTPISSFSSSQPSSSSLAASSSRVLANNLEFYILASDGLTDSSYSLEFIETVISTQILKIVQEKKYQ